MPLRGPLLLALALTSAACAPVEVVEVEPETEEVAEEDRLPGQGLPPRGQPACAPPGQSAGIEPPCDPATLQVAEAAQA